MQQSSESGLSRGNVYSLHAPVVPPNPSSTWWIVLKYCPKETTPRESRRFAGLSYFYLIWQFFKSLMMNTQSVTRCLNIRPWCLHQSVHFLRFQLLWELIVHLRDGFLHALVRIDQVSAGWIRHTNSLLLRRYWADLLNELCEIRAPHSENPRWSESYIFHPSFPRKSPIQRTGSSQYWMSVFEIVYHDRRQ